MKDPAGGSIRAVTTGNEGEMSLRLGDGQVIPLSEGDVRLLQLTFHTHCPDCEHAA